MKRFRTILLLFALSFGLAWLFYYLTDDVIVSSWTDKLAEIGIVTLVIFIPVLILYFIARSAVRKATALGKKKPSEPEGPKA